MNNAYLALNIEELRARFLQHTRKAYELSPLPDRPRILDIGCGRGLPAIELARLSGGFVVGIDPDDAALSLLQQRIAQEGLSKQVTIHHRSLCETDFADESLDLLWEEGVLHQLDDSSSFQECNRLLKPCPSSILRRGSNPWLARVLTASRSTPAAQPWTSRVGDLTDVAREPRSHRLKFLDRR